jgi:hypothetical protein
MTDETPNKGGRPTIFNAELAAWICAELASGRALVDICAEKQAPGTTTVYRWLQENEQFRDLYARAREDQADTLADELLVIADDGRNDWMRANDPDNLGYAENKEAIRRSQLRIDTRKWIASKLKAKKYGDKVEQTIQNPDGSAIKFQQIILTGPNDVADGSDTA